MKIYIPQLDQKSFLINLEYPKNQKKYIEYYHSKSEKFKIFLKLDKILILKRIDNKDFSNFLFITRVNDK